jgi:hypothetical protein
MKSIATSLFLITAFLSVPAFSAPLCRQLFHRIDSSLVSKTVKSIAALKLHVDLEKSRHGKLSPSQNLLQLDYEIKYQELIAALKGKISEQEIRQLIHAQILELQLSQKQEQEIRKVHLLTEHNRRKPYVLDQVIPAPAILYENFVRQMRLTPDGKNLLYNDSMGEMFALDLATHNSVDLGFKVNVYNLDGLTVVGVQNEGRLSVYDLQTNKLLKEISLNRKEKGYWQNVDILPGKNLALLTGNPENGNWLQATLVDLSSEKVINLNEFPSLKQTQGQSNLKLMRLLDEKYLITYNGELLQRIEIQSGKVVESLDIKMTEPTDIPVLLISKDRKTAALYVAGHSISIDPYNFTTTFAEYKDDKTIPRPFKTYQTTESFPEAIVTTYQREVNVIDLHSLEKITDFKGDYFLGSNREDLLSGVTATPDREKAVVLFKRQKAGLYYLEIWSKNP